MRGIGGISSAEREVRKEGGREGGRGGEYFFYSNITKYTRFYWKNNSNPTLK